MPARGQSQPADLAPPATAATPASQPNADPGMAQFLDRLMMAESAGRDHARNPRSTALGPYQFIVSTFLEVTRRHFAAETQALDLAQLLALRTDRAFARRAAEAYTKDNAALLAAQGLAASHPNLRLAFLVGPGAAVRVLQSPPEAPLAGLLGPGVIRANPFMLGMSAAGLIAKSARDVDPRAVIWVPPAIAGGAFRPARPAIAVACDLTRPSCRRWLALAERRVRVAVAPRPARR
jgi:hypothetical protein